MRLDPDSNCVELKASVTQRCDQVGRALTQHRGDGTDVGGKHQLRSGRVCDTEPACQLAGKQPAEGGVDSFVLPSTRGPAGDYGVRVEDAGEALRRSCHDCDQDSFRGLGPPDWLLPR